MGNLRLMILNYSDKPRTFTVTFVGTKSLYPIDWCKPDGDPANPAERKYNVTPGTEFSFLVPAGTIYGLVADDEVSLEVDVPDDKVSVITAVGKNPWPPPPEAPAVYDPTDFDVRYANFDRGTADGTLDSQIIRYSLQAAASTSPKKGHA